MSNKNLFYSNWKGFVSKQNLNEMEERYRNLIDNATNVAKRNPKILPFSSIFGDKLRIAVPLVQRNLGKVQTILDFIYNFGAPNSMMYQPISITSETKQVRAKVAGRDTVKEIADFVVTRKQNAMNPKTNEPYVRETKTNIPTMLKKITLEYKKLIEGDKKGLESADTDYRRLMTEERIRSYESRITVANQMLEWWQKNQSKIVEDPDLVKYAVSLGNTNFINGDWTFFAQHDDSQIGETNNEYSIIYSRAPIDVLRMSDFPSQDIESCHSQGNSYFYCAIAEAQNEGAIAFVVKTEDLEDLDLQDEEIFEDTDVGVSGIMPLQRVRIRALKDGDTGLIFGVPEKRTYPSNRVNGFQKEVQKFLTQAQKSAVVSTMVDGSKKVNLTSDFDNLKSLGGSYFDNPIGLAASDMILQILKEEGVEPTQQQQEVINKLNSFGRVKYAGQENQFRQFVNDEDEDEDDEEQFNHDEQEGEYNRAVREIRNNTYLNDSSGFEWNWGDNYPTIPLSLSLKFTFSEQMFTQTFLKEREQNLDSQIRKLLEDDSNFTYPDSPMNDVYVVKSTGVVTINIVYEENLDDAFVFRRRATDFINFCRNHPKEDLENELVALLIEAGFVTSDEIAESPTQKLAAFNKWVDDNTEHFYYSKEGFIHTYRILPSKRQFQGFGNLGVENLLIAKLTPAQSRYLSANTINTRLNTNADSSIFDKYFRSLLETEPLGTAEQQSLSFLSNDFQMKGKSKPINDLMDGITFDVTLQNEMPIKDPVSAGYDRSDNNIWVYGTVRIKFDEKTGNVINLIKLIEGLEKNPNLMYEAISDIVRGYLSNFSFTPEQRGFKTRGEEEKEKEEVNTPSQTSTSTELTESRKRIIKEKLMLWYKKQRK